MSLLVEALEDSRRFENNNLIRLARSAAADAVHVNQTSHSEPGRRGRSSPSLFRGTSCHIKDGDAGGVGRYIDKTAKEIPPNPPPSYFQAHTCVLNVVKLVFLGHWMRHESVCVCPLPQHFNIALPNSCLGLVRTSHSVGSWLQTSGLGVSPRPLSQPTSDRDKWLQSTI